MLLRHKIAFIAMMLMAQQGLAQDVEWVDVPLADNTWWEQDGEFRSDEIEIPVAAGSALEHMLGMREGAMIVYDLSVEMDDTMLLQVEFHGHTERQDEEPGTVMFYTVHSDGQEQGVLRAPFTGVHGWYLNNTSDEDVVVILKVAGYYEE